jgi:hypothetical protein
LKKLKSQKKGMNWQTKNMGKNFLKKNNSRVRWKELIPAPLSLMSGPIDHTDNLFPGFTNSLLFIINTLDYALCIIINKLHIIIIIFIHK